jgi:FAD/FMN-containing dehydrogenase
VTILFSGMTTFTFGHFGDGNLHFNRLALKGSDTPDHLTRVNRIVHDLLVTLGGSISAEHGIGRLRPRYKSGVASNDARMA